ncbi:hypothetical protein MTO98_11330 [Mucilaginibacter sp. SMC90]|uniref:hypothetical protein n=1 Tax=Mucilaginibacter sp. SMC90 TaxID=2929803 RepID=UPI001FB4FE79|nr:hypothetical protein [Mucilaginibacter sp. SMC90]UOE51669.1 hypothetical protein MTO98_11330 [Mucilaginibacter sp. SMC90]
MYLSQNPQISTVLVEFSNNQIATKMDDWTWGYTYMSNMFPQYASFMDVSDWEVLARHNSKYFMNCVGIAARTNLGRTFSFNYDFTGKTGGYLKIDTDKHIRASDVANMKPQTMAGKDSISTVNIQYLRKIVDYCKSKHKNIFLIRSPQHPLYEYLDNEATFSSVRKQNFSDVEFLDFNNFPLNPDEFADLGHLNFKGASRYSAYINQRILNGMLKTGSTASLNKIDTK